LNLPLGLNPLLNPLHQINRHDIILADLLQAMIAKDASVTQSLEPAVMSLADFVSASDQKELPCQLLHTGSPCAGDYLPARHGIQFIKSPLMDNKAGFFPHHAKAGFTMRHPRSDPETHNTIFIKDLLTLGNLPPVFMNNNYSHLYCQQ